MQTAFLALVNYVTTALLIVFNCQSFLTLKRHKESRGLRLRVWMKIEMISIFTLCFTTLYIRTGDPHYLGFLVMQFLFNTGITIAYRKLYPKINGLLFDQMILLLGIGIMILSRLDMEAAERQFVIEAVALVLALFIPGFIRARHRLERYGFVYLGIGLLILRAVFAFAGERLGARIWIKIFGVSMQPFEFVKISFIFGCAAVLLRAKTFYEKAAVYFLAACHILIMVASKDLGGAFLFAMIFWVLLYATSGNLFWILGGIAGAGTAFIAAYKLFSHVQVRVVAWRNPFAVVDNEGYQLSQSLFAIGNGGFFGTGLLRGAPEQIPVVTTDYVFSAICEELGAIFALGILFIYLNCLFLLIRITKECAEDYYRLVFTGFAALYASQVFLNVGGVTRMIPSTGVPLPFISAGGSCAASMILMFMLVQGMQERKNPVQEQRFYKAGFRPAVLSARAARAGKNCMIGTCLLVLAIDLYFLVFSLTEARTVIFHSYNRRQVQLEEQNSKGTIYDSQGNPLATTMLLEEEEIRRYPYDNLFSHVVGQTQNGKSGLEAVKEIDLLSASVSELTKLTYRIRGEQVPGNNLFTTLNTDAQKLLYAVLSDAGTQEASAGCMLRTDTGGLLASVSLPDYNPNQMEEYSDEEAAPLFNRCFYGIYSTEGSSAALEQAGALFGGQIPTPFGDVVTTEQNGITPIGLALFAAACANQGSYMQPYVSERLTNAGGRVIYRNHQEETLFCDAATATGLLSGFYTYSEQGNTLRYVISAVPSGKGGGYHILAAAVTGAGENGYAYAFVLENRSLLGGEQEAVQKVLKLASYIWGN